MGGARSGASVMRGGLCARTSEGTTATAEVLGVAGTLGSNASGSGTSTCPAATQVNATGTTWSAGSHGSIWVPSPRASASC